MRSALQAGLKACPTPVVVQTFRSAVRMAVFLVSVALFSPPPHARRPIPIGTAPSRASRSPATSITSARPTSPSI